MLRPHVLRKTFITFFMFNCRSTLCQRNNWNGLKWFMWIFTCTWNSVTESSSICTRIASFLPPRLLVEAVPSTPDGVLSECVIRPIPDPVPVPGPIESNDILMSFCFWFWSRFSMNSNFSLSSVSFVFYFELFSCREMSFGSCSRQFISFFGTRNCLSVAIHAKCTFA